MNEAMLRNLSDQELVRYAGQQLPPELYSRLVTLFDQVQQMQEVLDQHARDEIDEVDAFNNLAELVKDL